MQRCIVSRRIRGVFRALDDGDCRPMLASLAPQFVYVFHGEHALGGRRTTRESVERWWQRVFRLLPGHRFDVEDVVANGAPWRLRVAVRVTVTGRLPDGSTYRNTLFQFLTIRRGQVTSIESLENTQVLERALAVMATHGVSEAIAPPVED